ncbi:unnamed protein product [Oppiella nova]|uniref:Uncharacterized protein n=1 Tax=Oppiella nova TaxID=334625 RepID=A0A7R9MTN2_9ACAR|nr:unnamed protein product [Oppiella nova]CAG2183416.1 unnamed protein product [Oppiella nova]
MNNSFYRNYNVLQMVNTNYLIEIVFFKQTE